MQKLLVGLTGLGVVVLAMALFAGLVEAALDWRGFLAVLVVTAGLGLGVLFSRRRVPRRAVLEVDLDRPLVEQAPEGGLAGLAMPHVVTLRELVSVIERAAEDRRVVGLLVRLGPVGMSMAHAQELSAAVERFRGAGKKTIAWAATFGEAHAANGEYVFASSFDEVHMQPGSDVGLIGFALPQPYLRGLLDRLGIVPRLDGRKAYKTARYPLTEHEMPEPARVSLSAVLESLMSQLCRHVADRRSIDEAKVRRLIDSGPLTGVTAVEEGLLDRLSYRDEVDAQLKEELKAELVTLPRYLPRARRLGRRGAQVALIYGEGVVSRGRHQRRPLFGMPQLGAEDLTAALRTATESSKVKAIVLRIDSPGGSAVASETIWRAVKQARQGGKPIVVSMGSLAGSGGYYIAASADRIVAQPGTLTGSIGVVSGKLVTRQAWAKAGVNWQSVQAGEQASIWDASEEFSDAQWQTVQAMLDDVYERFKQRVAEGRKLDAEAVEAAAQGRVWTGQMAKEHGLVDDLGGLSRAVEHARELAGVPPEKPVHLVELPSPRPWLAVHMRPRLAQQQPEIEALKEELRPIAAARAMLDPARDGWLRMPTWW